MGNGVDLRACESARSRLRCALPHADRGNIMRERPSGLGRVVDGLSGDNDNTVIMKTTWTIRIGRLGMLGQVLALGPRGLAADPGGARQILATTGVKGGLVVHLGCGSGGQLWVSELVLRKQPFPTGYGLRGIYMARPSDRRGEERIPARREPALVPSSLLSQPGHGQLLHCLPHRL